MFAAVVSVVSGARIAQQRRAEQEHRGEEAAKATVQELVERARLAEQNRAEMEPGQLAKRVGGTSAMKSALDLGNLEAVRTLVELDPLTLTLPCDSNNSPPLVYLREGGGTGGVGGGEGSVDSAGGAWGAWSGGDGGGGRMKEKGGTGTTTAPAAGGSTAKRPHPRAPELVPLLESLLLERGMVPFADGSSLPVHLLLEFLEGPERGDDDALKARVRQGEIDLRQYRTLRALGALPVGVEKDDPGLAGLIALAKARINPLGSGAPGNQEEGEEGGLRGACELM